METFMSGAMVIEGALLSFLLALWMTWMGLRGLFRLIPATINPATGRMVRPIQFVVSREEGSRRHIAA